MPRVHALEEVERYFRELVLVKRTCWVAEAFQASTPEQNKPAASVSDPLIGSGAESGQGGPDSVIPAQAGISSHALQDPRMRGDDGSGALHRAAGDSRREILGFLALDPADSLVSSLYLTPEARGQGIGKALLDRAKAECPLGLGLWTFVANTGARRFYEREGFREVARTDGDNEEGLPDILFRWSPETEA